ncbi:MAG: hypothetical protein K1X88_21315, partial [Nannocystaceae bacterium]|nr:hypothetical protein [Nannocystaceae bacterium]
MDPRPPRRVTPAPPCTAATRRARTQRAAAQRWPLAIAAMVLSLSAAHADASPMALPRRTVGPDGGVVTESSQVLPAWAPAVAVSLTHEADLAHPPTTGATPVADIASRTRADLGVALGLFGWVELGAQLPVVLRQRMVADYGGGARTGLGDVRAGIKGTLLRLPRRGIGLGLSFDVTAPTGSDRAQLGLGAPGFAPQLLLEFRGARAIRAAINLGYLARPDVRALGRIAGDELTSRAALRVPLSSRREIAFAAELDARIALVRGAASDVTGLLGLRGRTRSGVAIGVYASGGPGLAFGSTEIGGVLAFGWAPPRRTGDPRPFDGSARPKATALALRHDALARHDAPAPTAADPRDPDRDRSFASSDRCPNIPEDRDGFDDGDGCPELDDDHDAIADAFDLCPRAPEIVNGALDDDGCPDRIGDDGVAQSFASLAGLMPTPRLAFTPGTDDLTADARTSLQRWIELARVNPWIGRLELSIYVHRTDVPADDRAHALARAAAVVALCEAAGLEPGRVRVR